MKGLVIQSMGGNLGLLVLRLGLGGFMCYLHGWPKLLDFTNLMTTFPDPLQIGPAFSLALVVFAELFCSILVIVGLATRIAVIPLIITMLVAIFLIHGEDPLQKKELAYLFLFGFTALGLTGAGGLSLDRLVLKRR